MKVQIRYTDGGIVNKEIDNVVDFVREMEKRDNNLVVGKMSFDFLDGARLILHSNGEYQILGGFVNYPKI